MDITTLATAWAKIIGNATTEQKNWFFQYILVKFFWKQYKEYLTQNILIQKSAEIEANIVLQEQITQIDVNPSPIMQAIQNEAELEYSNMFWVLQKSLNMINKDNNWTIDEDKLKRIKDLSKEFSGDKMQEYIAWILAGEYNNPWSYSLKTMEIIKSLSKDDILLFKRFSTLLIDNDFVYTWIFNINKDSLKTLSDMWLSWTNFLYLQELWLFNTTKTANIIWLWLKEKGMDILLQKQWTLIEAEYNIWWKKLWIWFNKEITVWGQIKLTNSWKEILLLIWYDYNDICFNIVKKSFLEIWFQEYNTH